jgi:hypothetical protein
MDLVKFQPEDSEKVAFAGSLLIQLISYGRMPCRVLAKGVQEGGLDKLLTDPANHVWQDAMMEEGSSNIEMAIIEGFSQQEVADLDETLSPVVKGFSKEKEVPLYEMMHAPLVLDFNITEIVLMLGCFEFSADFNLLFDRFDTLALALYRDEFIIVGSPKQIMMWCEKILTNENGMKDKGV